MADAGDHSETQQSAEEPLLVLPQSLRTAFKDPFGPIYTEPATLLADAGRPIITVGDVVTYTLEQAGHKPAISLVDGKTEREAVSQEIADAVGTGEITVSNPQGTLTAALFEAIVDAVGRDHPVRIVVEGEEDLAAVPAVLAAPVGATVVYGQPGEGMVAIDVTDSVQDEFRELLSKMDGDTERARSLLGA